MSTLYKGGDRVCVNELTYESEDIGKEGTIVGYHDRDYDGHWYYVRLDGEGHDRVMIEHELDDIGDEFPPVLNT